MEQKQPIKKINSEFFKKIENKKKKTIKILFN